MYQALYRKWRPRVFEDVAGQPHITTTLKNELIAGRVAHAYLFTGSRGTGKTTCAKILAKAVNCLHPNNGDPCNECESCRGIDSGAVMDVVEIDAASNNGVDNIRDLREETVYSPASVKYRVYIIDEVHMLSGGAFNALLKTLEEPPAYVIFILATTEVHKIPATILSRCQRFDFRRIPAEDIAARLKYVAAAENIALTDGGAAMLSRLADGALRDGLSLLDRCAGIGGTIDEQAVEKAAGLSDRHYLFELSEAAGRHDYSAALQILDRLYASSADMERLCEELIGHFRSLMLMKSADGASGLIGCGPEEAEQLRKTAAAMTIEEIFHALDTLQSTLDALRRTPARRVTIEMGFLRLCRPELDASPSALLARIGALEAQMKAGIPAAAGTAAASTAAASTAAATASVSAARSVSEPSPAPIESRAAPGGENPETEKPRPASEPPDEETGDRPFEAWPEALEALAGLDPPLRGFLNGSAAVVRGNYVLVDSSNSMFGELIRQSTHQKPLKEAVQKAAGRPYKVGILTKRLTRQAQDDPMDEIIRNASRQGLGINEK